MEEKSSSLRHGLLALSGLCVLLLAAAPAEAQVCASPGRDGSNVSLSGVINTYYPGNATVAAGATSISVGSPTGASTTIQSGDLLLVIQMQAASVDTNDNDNRYGAGTSTGNGSTAINNSGLYEYVVAQSSAGASVSIRGAGTGNGLVNSYTKAAVGTNGQRTFQVVRVPQYSTATLTSGLTAKQWDGSTGGILVFDVSGNLNLGSATVSVSGLGFRGGGGRQLAGGGGGSSDYRNATTQNDDGQKGEGIGGTPWYVLDQTFGTLVNTGIEGYPNGSTARGGPANAGGGGTDGNPSANDQNTGGGGGANGGAGGLGGNSWSSNIAAGGVGGAAFTQGAVNRMIMGGGGGAGTTNNGTGGAAGISSSGAAGGGIVMIRTGTVSGSGSISADGAAASNAVLNDGSGGGGAGGSVLVYADDSGLGSLTVSARGGNGGTNTGGGSAHGPGGGGGGGLIALSGSATTNVGGGAHGTTAGGIAYGSTNGSSGTIISGVTLSQIPGTSPGSQCAPSVTLTKSVSPSGNQAPGTDLAYTIAFTNSGGVAARNLVITDPIPSFTDLKVGSVTSSLGTTGLTVVVAYSNDSGSTWTYTPVSGAGGASAGYDRLVTNIRWTFTGNLSQTSPNNAGSVSFTSKIR